MDDEDDADGRSSSSLVAECLELRELLSARWKRPADGALEASMLHRTEQIFDRYQENGSLLDPFLAELVPALSSCALTELQRAQRAGTAATDRAALDARATFAALYTLMKVRGHKTVGRLMPHSVDCFEPVARAVLGCEPMPEWWQARFCLFVWLHTLVLVPFDLRVVDSEDGALIEALVRCLLGAVTASGRPAQGAVMCLARLVARRDLSGKLESTLRWCLLEEAATMSSERRYLLSRVLKHGRREELRRALRPHLRALLRGGDDRRSAAAHSVSCGEVRWRLNSVKLWQSLALVLLPKDAAQWCKRRGARVLFAAPSASGEGTPSIASFTSAENGRLAEERARMEAELQYWRGLCAEETAVIEDALDAMLCGLRDRDTAVRWSAAKGIGRIAARLPRLLAEQVVDAVLADALDADNADERRWHGSCLALAELVRRSVVASGGAALHNVLRFNERALRFDVRTATHSVGTQVRDAACYLSWALARAYEASAVQTHGASLACSLLRVALLDREVNCRRAAAAALQECIGRLGDDFIPHGLKLLPLVNFYTLSARKASYLKLAVQVARLSDAAAGCGTPLVSVDYREALVHELVEHKTRHWDGSVRALAAQSLHELLSVEAGKSATYEQIFSARREALLTNARTTLLSRATFTPDPLACHGALVALAFTLRCRSVAPPADFLEDVRRAVLTENALAADTSTKSRARAATGRRGAAVASRPRAASAASLITSAKCAVIASLAARSALHDERHHAPVQQLLRNALCGAHDEALRDAACEAATELAAASPAMLRRLVEEVVMDNVALPAHAQCAVDLIPLLGAAALNADGTREDDLMARLSQRLLATLSSHSASPETRCHAVRGVVRLVAAQRLSVDDALRRLLDAMDDYQVDHRGDVGSFVREAAMTAAADVLLDSECGLSLREGVVVAMLRQLLERIDRTREVAMRQLRRLLAASSAVAETHVASAAECAGDSEKGRANGCDSVLRAVRCALGVEGAVDSPMPSTATIFLELAPALLRQLPPALRDEPLLGIAAAAGGSGHQAPLAARALMRCVSADTLTRLYVIKRHDRRLAQPLLRGIQLCLADAGAGGNSPDDAALLPSERAETNGGRRTSAWAALAARAVGDDVAPSHDVAFVASCIEVQAELMAFPTAYSTAAETLCRLLGHRTPRVRRLAAEALYTRMLLLDDDEEGSSVACASGEGVMDIVGNTSWESASNDEIRELQRDLCVKLGVDSAEVLL